MTTERAMEEMTSDRAMEETTSTEDLQAGIIREIFAAIESGHNLPGISPSALNRQGESEERRAETRGRGNAA